jgi:hypothetical protein
VPQEVVMVMVESKLDGARTLFVEGRVVHIGGRPVRFFPSFRDLAHAHGCNASTVSRWARREGLLAARAERLAADRDLHRGSMKASTADLADEMLSLANARWGSQRRAPAVRDVATLVRLLLTAAGIASPNPRLLRTVDALRRRLERGAGGR